MRSGKLFNTFSALSFEAAQVRDRRLTAIADSPPRLTPESVKDFDVHTDGAAHRDLPDHDRHATTRHWPPRVLLLLSNDPEFQLAVRQTLPQQIELLPVRHASQAVRLAQEDFIDAALLDLDLDDGQGWHTAEWLLANDATLRLLLAAEPGARLDLIAGVNAGFVLEKPLIVAQVVDRLTLLLGQSEHQRFQHNVSLQNFLRYAHPLSISEQIPVSIPPPNCMRTIGT